MYRFTIGVGRRISWAGLTAALTSLAAAASTWGATGYVVEQDGTLNAVDTGTLLTSPVGDTGSDPVFALARAPDGTLYGVRGATSPALVTIDPASSATTPVGTGLGAPDEGFDLAARPDTTLWLTGHESATFRLYSVDRVAGAATQTGSDLSRDVFGLEAACDGTLYGIAADTSGRDLVRVDSTTGAVSLVGSLGSLPVSENDFDLAFDHAAGILYAVTPAANLYIISTSSGQATLQGTFAGLSDAYNLTLTSPALCPATTPLATGSSPGDADPPQTKITKGAPNKTAATSVRFKFRSDEPGSTFQCKLDRKRWRRCSSPRKVRRLDEGRHKFRVRAIDAAGNVDPTPARDRFKVLER